MFVNGIWFVLDSPKCQRTTTLNRASGTSIVFFNLNSILPEIFMILSFCPVCDFLSGIVFLSLSCGIRLLICSVSSLVDLYDSSLWPSTCILWRFI